MFVLPGTCIYFARFLLINITAAVEERSSREREVVGSILDRVISETL